MPYGFHDDKSKAELGAFIDFFYPIGSYYETSDSNFNPNNEWGGTWIQEKQGQVHVSAGSNYAVSGALSNVSDGGATSYTVPTTKLSDEQMAHGHGFTQPKIPNHVHTTSSGTSKLFCTIASVEGLSGTYELPAGTGRYGFASARGWSDVAGNTYTGNPSSLGSCTNGAVSNLSGASSTRTAHGHGSVSAMQPYINVYRWHRTA